MEISNTFLVLVPIVMGVVSAVKMAGLNSKYAPLLSVGLGIACAIGLGVMDFDSVLQGVAIGLSASGLYSGGKAMLQKDEYL